MQGIIQKMRSEGLNPVNYYLPLSGNEIFMNELIGKPIEICYLDEINCISCGRKTYRSFAQGYCYPCFISLAETDECILHPEKCQAHLGISRDMSWSKQHCLQDHFVYLAITSGLKVGVTRSTQIPTRWIDQGAIQAIKLAKTPNRYLAGTLEVELKKSIADKTNWRRMLENKAEQVDLITEKQKVSQNLPDEMRQYVINNNEIMTLDYPVTAYPEKVKSVNLEKAGKINEVLKGIKGQYLIFADNSVINIRKYTGYRVKISY